MFQDIFGIIVDPGNLDYRYFLNDENKTELLSLARLAGLHNKQTNLTKEDLTNFLSIEIPKVLPILVNKLNSKNRLICEIVVSAGGCMSVWEVNARMKIESRILRKSSNSLNKQLPQQNGWNNEKNIKLQDIDDDDDDDDDDEMRMRITFFFCLLTLMEYQNPCYHYLGLQNLSTRTIVVIKKNLKSLNPIL